jgi:hypothetical protein
MGDARSRRMILRPDDGRVVGCTEHCSHAAIAPETRRLVPQAEDVMTVVDPEILTATERDQVERWRAGELERAGFDVSLARKLAARLDIDLHLAVDLIADGCPPDLAARILL